MINKVTFPEDYDLMVEKESQRRFPTKKIVPGKYDRMKNPYEVFLLFQKDAVFNFKPGVNIIVGENGSGKSSLISLIKNYIEHQSKYIEVDGDVTTENTIFFDGEKDNPVVAIPGMANPNDSDTYVPLLQHLMFAQEESHGESMLPALDYILTQAKGGYTIFMDEPETALSLKNQISLANKFKMSAGEYGNQLIISTHSLAIIQLFPSIFDMETRQWWKTGKYLKENYV
jgi:predicted ATPase